MSFDKYQPSPSNNSGHTMRITMGTRRNVKRINVKSRGLILFPALQASLVLDSLVGVMMTMMFVHDHHDDCT